MAENGHAPFVSPNSATKESVENTSTTLFGGFSMMGGRTSGSEYVTSTHRHHHHANANALVPTPPPPPPPPAKPVSGNDPVQTPPSAKKPRGRPSGSKNKSKAPIIIREDTDTVLKPIIIEIPDGHDITEALISLAKRHHAGITVLSGSGIVREVTLRHPMSCATACPMQGPFLMLSLAGTFVNGDCGGGRVPPQFITKPPSFSFAIYLFDADRGHVFGGSVGGSVVSVGGVLVTATLIKKPKFHRIGVVDGIIQEIEGYDPRRATTTGTVVNNNADHSAAVEPNNNVNAMTAGSVGFGVASAAAAAAAAAANIRPPFPTDGANVMQY